MTEVSAHTNNLQQDPSSATDSGPSKVSWWRTEFGEEEVAGLSAAMANEHISQGPVTEDFEKEFATAMGVPYAVATTSGSVALLMALMALGIGRDDEVIVPNRTFIATAHAALLLGAKVVLVDVEPEAPNMDATQIRAAITSRTKAIMPVHLNGRPADMGEINRIAAEYGLQVVEDACQAMFSRNSAGFLGTQSSAGCFSLGVTKLISTGQGGMVVTKDEETFERLKLVRNHGVPNTFAGTYRQIGLNFKFTDLLASIGLVQLSRVPSRIQHVNAVYRRYASGLNELELPFLRLIPVNVADGEVPLYIEALCSQREPLMKFLETQGIESRPFHPDLHLSPHLNNSGQFPNSKLFSEQGVFLPCGPDQALGNVDRVLESLNSFNEISR